MCISVLAPPVTFGATFNHPLQITDAIKKGSAYDNRQLNSFTVPLCVCAFLPGVVYNYSEAGVCRDEHGWEQSVSLINQWHHYLEQFSSTDMWDPQRFERPEHIFQSTIPFCFLFYTKKMSFWGFCLLYCISNLAIRAVTLLISDSLVTKVHYTACLVFYRYEEHKHNCYTYALTFINCLLAPQGKRQLTKTVFTEKFVLPRTRRASRYITLYQEISHKSFNIVDSSHREDNSYV
ncbi:uncharacterized protein LOC121298386 [Polyodon spathula]|uniref:uncharacterized protein LOC121298386 n=1 Tax=Polyodon spathula TaxID=7913 RepID=UPI001B7DF596|nr:uncharacterized protein LOC121298386 [Polyodon spathula]